MVSRLVRRFLLVSSILAFPFIASAQLSGLYFYGSGLRQSTSYGGDSRGLGAGGSQRLRPNGTIVPRNNFVQDPLHRIDLRLQQRIPVGPRVSVHAMLELFNLLDRANFASYTTQESSASYGKPNASTNLAYASRTVQLGFRLGF